MIIEFNATDDDLGVHGAFDDQGWSELCVMDPTGRPILVVDPRNQLNDLTMAGIFFESREPPASEFSMADLEPAFPEGMYKVRGQVLRRHRAHRPGDIHPRSAGTTGDHLTRDRRRAGAAGTPGPAPGPHVSWDRVRETVDGEPVKITGYQVIVTKEVPDDRHGFSRPTYDVHVPASVNSLSVPAEFLEPDTVYELEVLALEESGNQTISVGFFKTN